MVARIYVFRVYGRHWLMCAKPIPAPQHRLQSSLVSGSGSLPHHHHQGAPHQHQQQKESNEMSGLSDESIEASTGKTNEPELSDASNVKPTSRMQALTHKLLQRVREEIKEMEDAPKDSLKGRLNQMWKKMLERQDPTEVFLREFANIKPSPSATSQPSSSTATTSASSSIATNKSKMSSVQRAFNSIVNPEITIHPTEVLFSGSIPQPTVAEELLSIARRGKDEHKWWLWGSIALIPITASMGILPGPNVFLAYNAFRVMSHWKARVGALKLLALLEAHSQDPSKGLITYQPDADLFRTKHIHDTRYNITDTSYQHQGEHAHKHGTGVSGALEELDAIEDLFRAVESKYEVNLSEDLARAKRKIKSLERKLEKKEKKHLHANQQTKSSSPSS